MARTADSAPQMQRAVFLRRAAVAVFVRPLVLLVVLLFVAAVVCGDGDPIKGAVRFVLDAGTTVRSTGIEGEYTVTGCLDTPGPSSTTAVASLTCRHVGTKNATLASITADVRLALVIAYVISLVTSWLIADHLTCLREVFTLIVRRTRHGRAR